jgi:capsular polysaccharide biosynthesis protein
VSGLRAPDLLRGLRRHWVVVVVTTLLGGVLGGLATLLVADTYVAEARVGVVHDARVDVLDDEPEDTYETVDEANRRMNTAAVRAMSDDVVDRTAAATDLTPAEVREQVTVEAVAGTDVLSVSATTSDPDLAAELARAASDAFVQSTRDTGREQLRAAALDLETEAAEILAAAPDPVPQSTSGFTDQLYAQALELRTRAAFYEGLGEVVSQPRGPGTAAAPGPERGAAYGVAGGLLVGVAAALLLSTRRRERGPSVPQPGPPVLAGTSRP